MTCLFQSRGADAATAHDRARAIIDEMLRVQSTAIAFERPCFALAMLFVCALSLLLWLKKVRGGAPLECALNFAQSHREENAKQTVEQLFDEF